MLVGSAYIVLIIHDAPRFDRGIHSTVEVVQIIINLQTYRPDID